jgi:iron complex transport system ATP-binding protein
MGNFFEIENFTCGYDNKFHISAINIAISKGSFVGVIGPNGCGKTTLFRGIAGELKSKFGAITINGKNVKQMTFKEKARHLAVVTQDIEVPNMTVEDYVLMGRLPYHKTYQFFDTKKDFAIAEKYMELTDVAHVRHKYLNQLSGGERQLIAITRALVQEPELLLLDEPTSHLDITHQVQVLNLVQQLNAQLGLTVLMIIHDLNLAGEYCDQLVLINNGRVQMSGTPEEVLTFSNIEAVYGTVVVTKTNPVSGKPAIFLVSQKVLNKLKNDFHLNGITDVPIVK